MTISEIFLKVFTDGTFLIIIGVITIIGAIRGVFRTITRQNEKRLSDVFIDMFFNVLASALLFLFMGGALCMLLIFVLDKLGMSNILK